MRRTSQTQTQKIEVFLCVFCVRVRVCVDGGGVVYKKRSFCLA